MATWGAPEHLGQVKRKNTNMRCDMMMFVLQKVDVTLVLFICWRVLESMSRMCGRLGFVIVDIPLFL